MINFFRNIRRKLANENKFQRYMRYAVGEVLLIMVGIFMALQLQNWNEKRKQEIRFKSTLEQLYNTITDDSWAFDFAARDGQNNINTIDRLLNFNDSIPPQNLPMAMWSITFSSKKDYISESLQILQDLDFNSENKEHTKLARQLQSYATLVNNKNSDNFNPFQTKIDEILLENNIAFPKFDLDQQNLGFTGDSIYYNKDVINTCLKLLQDKNFRTQLKSKRTQLTIFTLDFRVLHNDALSMLKLIKDYYPDVKLLYQDVGIIGTSIDGFDDVGAHSTPMTLTNEDQSIWEIEMYLKEGHVKFRCRDSWAINWGGETFPKGEANFEGPDIPVLEAGNYKVILNLTENTYEFIKQDD
jgi:hypothetical protein